METGKITLRAVALTVLVLVGCSDLLGPDASVTGETGETPPAETELSSRELYDDFSDDALNSDLWTVFSETEEVEVQETGQRLEITFPATTIGSVSQNGVITRCLFVGDFDVQLDYALIGWPAKNGVRMGLVAAGRNVVARHSSGVQDATAGEWYHTNFSGVVGGLTSTTHSGGNLRLTRSGATVTGYYWEGSDWVLLSSRTVSLDVEEIPISLHAWTHDSTFGKKEVRVAFDNLILNEGTLSCPEPAIKKAVVDIKPDSDENTINLKSQGGVRVAVLSTRTDLGQVSDFDATTIDPEAVEFGPGGATPMQPGTEIVDVDADGDLDMVFRFDIQAAALSEEATEACVSGQAGGKAFAGCDGVRVLEDRGGGKGRP